MKITLTTKDIYRELGPKMVVYATPSEISDLAAKIQQADSFQCSKPVVADDGCQMTCNLRFVSDGDKECSTLFGEEINISWSPKTAARAAILLKRLAKHPNDAFQYIDLEAATEGEVTLIVQSVRGGA